MRNKFLFIIVAAFVACATRAVAASPLIVANYFISHRNEGSPIGNPLILTPIQMSHAVGNWHNSTTQDYWTSAGASRGYLSFGPNQSVQNLQNQLISQDGLSSNQFIMKISWSLMLEGSNAFSTTKVATLDILGSNGNRVIYTMDLYPQDFQYFGVFQTFSLWLPAGAIPTASEQLQFRVMWYGNQTLDIRATSVVPLSWVPTWSGWNNVDWNGTPNPLGGYRVFNPDKILASDFSSNNGSFGPRNPIDWWRRDIEVGHAGDYPYIGPYDQSNIDLLVYDMKLAQAAGVNAFKVYLYPPTSGSSTDWYWSDWAWTAFKQMLANAPPGFKLFIDDSNLSVATSQYTYAAAVANFQTMAQQGIFDNPAYLHIKGNPAYELPIIYERNPSNIQNLVAQMNTIHPIYTFVTAMTGYATVGEQTNVYGPYDMQIQYLAWNGPPDATTPNTYSYEMSSLYTNYASCNPNPPADAPTPSPATIMNSCSCKYFTAQPVDVRCFLQATLLQNNPSMSQFKNMTGVNSLFDWSAGAALTAPQYLYWNGSQYAWGGTPDTTSTAQMFTAYVQDAHASGYDATVTISPSHDDSATLGGPSNTTRLDVDGSSIRFQRMVSNALSANPDTIMIENWNGWGEAVQIEPSTAYTTGPYEDLKILSSALGQSFNPPCIPNDVVDPLRLPYASGLCSSAPPAIPVIMANPNVLYVPAGTAFQYQINASNNPSFYDATGLPPNSNITVNAGTGIISGTPSAADVGTYTLTLSASNSSGAGVPITLTLRVMAANVYKNIRSTTFYPFPVEIQNALPLLQAQLPYMKAAGFNTVWLVNRWDKYESNVNPPTYSDASFTNLQNVLGLLESNNMKAIIDLNYLGSWGAPAGIDYCQWTLNPTMYSAFVSYATEFLTRIQAYSGMVYIMVGTENSTPYYDKNCPNYGTWPENPTDPRIPPLLQSTIGNLPAQLPPSLRTMYKIGYHDDSIIALNWGAGATPIANPNPFDFLSFANYAIKSAGTPPQVNATLASSLANFNALYPGLPLIIGETGAPHCTPYGDSTQALQDGAAVSYALGQNMGFNLWGWNSFSDGSDCTQNSGTSPDSMGIMRSDGIAASPASLAVQTILQPAAPQITGSGLNTTYSPWVVWITGTDFNSNVKALLWINGNPWGGQISTVLSTDHTTVTLSLPSDLAPNGCNASTSITPCSMTVSLVDPVQNVYWLGTQVTLPNVQTPAITVQPTDQTVPFGQSATCSVTATGTPPLTYQWYKGVGAINGATSASYTTPATTMADNNSQFTVVVNNVANQPVTSSIATLHVNLPPAPTANSQSVATAFNSSIGVTLSGTDPNSLPLTYIVVSNPSHGTLSGSGPNQTYAPTAGYAGSDSFTFKVNNGYVDSAVATVSITVNNLPAPTANNQSVATNFNTSKAFALTGSDPLGLTLTYSVLTPPAHGNLTGTAPNLTYAPNSGYTGADSLTFKVNNGYVDSPSATVDITVNSPTNPTAQNQTVAITFNTPKAIILAASDPNNLPLTYSIISGPSHGVLSGSAPNMTYTSNTGYVGADSLTFKANNGFVDSNVAMINIAVNLPPAPTANPQSVATAFNTAKSITLSATDPTGLTLTYAITGNPSHGTLSGSGASQTYTPSNGYSGADSFTFKVNNGYLDSPVATVNVTVQNPGAPVASNQSVTTPFNTPTAITLQAADPNSLPLTYSIVANAVHGTLSGSAPNLTYTPNTGYIGADNFTFKANNGSVDSNVATVSITITSAPNQQPVAQNQSLTTPQDTPLAIQLQATDPDGDPLTYSLAGSASHGSITGTPPNVVYHPASGFQGSDSFVFKANDGFVDSNIATISITVTAPTTGNLPPPDVSGIDGKTYTLNDTISLNYSGTTSGFNWEFDPISFGTQAQSIEPLIFGSRASGSSGVATAAPRLSLATVSLTPGRYTVRVQAVNGSQTSQWASATVTLVSTDLASARVHPNPFRAARGDQNVVFDQMSANSTVKIFTVAGRWVKTLPAPSGYVPWDLTNDSGDKVASGLYLYLVTDGQGNKTRGKFTLIR